MRRIDLGTSACKTTEIFTDAPSRCLAGRIGKTTEGKKTSTIRVKFNDGRVADVDNAVDWDDDGHRAEPHLFVYGENGLVLASWPYADVAKVETLSKPA